MTERTHCQAPALIHKKPFIHPHLEEFTGVFMSLQESLEMNDSDLDKSYLQT